jgi:hypothetical protein
MENSLGKTGILSYFNGADLETEMTVSAFKLVARRAGVKLNWKLVSAFSAGAILASGIVYFSVKPVAVVPEAPEAVQVAAPKPEVHPVPAPKPPVVARVKIPPAPAERQPEHLPIREKPSPMPPPVLREKPVIAKVQPPPAPVIAPPAPAAPPPPVVETPVATPAPVAPPSPKAAENVAAKNVLLPAPKPEPHAAPSVTLTPGTLLFARIGQWLSSALNQPGDSFVATLTQPLIADDWVIAERGARLEGRVVDATQAGRIKGVGHLEISVVRVALSDGQNVRIHTEPYMRDGSAAFGIFARKPAEIPIESRLTFRILDPITITERVN